MQCPLYTGDLSVLDAFTAPPGERRLGMIQCAGGNRGMFNVGTLGYLRRRRWFSTTSAHMGVSSGIAIQAYYMGNGPITNGRVFSHDMSDRRMFNPWRRLYGQSPFDVDWVERVFRGEATGRGIDAHAVCEHPAPLYAVFGDPTTGAPIIEHLNTPERVWAGASFGTAVTGFARDTFFEGQPVTDGYFTAEQLPVRALLDRHPELTDVLVLTSGHYDPHPKLAPWQEMVLYRTGFARASSAVQELIRTRHIRFMEEANRVIQPSEVGGVRVLLLWVPAVYHPIKIPNEQSRELLRMGYRAMEQLFHERGH